MHRAWHWLCSRAVQGETKNNRNNIDTMPVEWGSPDDTSYIRGSKKMSDIQVRTLSVFIQNILPDDGKVLLISVREQTIMQKVL